MEQNKQLTITRIFNAPRQLVFDVWTQPEHLASWWGPRGFTNPVCEVDAKPGGKLRIDMKGPDGVTYPMTATFEEVKRPEKLIFISQAITAEGKPVFEIKNTIVFEDMGDKTRVTVSAVPFNVTPEAAPYLAGMEEGWSQSVDKLHNYLTDTQQNGDPIILERTYNAPAATVWSALTDTAQMKQWYFDVQNFAPVVGQEFSFLAGNDGKKWLHLCKVKEVVPGKKIAYTWRYDGHPGDSLVSFELFDEGDKTRMKLTHAGLDTFPAIADFKKDNFMGGWSYFAGTGLKKFVEPQPVA
jgi:uncharacterized protein YndB with AHSA1/START domain